MEVKYHSFSFFLQEISLKFGVGNHFKYFPMKFSLTSAFNSIGSEIIGLTRLTCRGFFLKQHQANFFGGGKMAFPVCHVATS